MTAALEGFSIAATVFACAVPIAFWLERCERRYQREQLDADFQRYLSRVELDA